MSLSKNTIYQTVIQCAYNKDYHNHITTNIKCVNDKEYHNFKMQSLNIQGKNLICLFMDIQTFLNKQKFYVPIQILIPDQFPYVAPLASVRLPGPNTIINPSNKYIDPRSCQISTNSLKKWDLSTSINKIIEEISASFNECFPIWQLQPGQNINTYRNSIGEGNNLQLSPNFSPSYNQSQTPYMQKFYQSVPVNQNVYNFNQTSNPNSELNKIEIQDNYGDEKFNSFKGTTSNDVNWDKKSHSSESTNYSMNSSNQNQIIGNCVSNNESNDMKAKLRLSPKENIFLSPFSQETQNVPTRNLNIIDNTHIQDNILSKTKEILIQLIKEKIQERIINEVHYQKETHEYLEIAKLHLDYKNQKIDLNLKGSDKIMNKIQEELDKIKEEIYILKNEVTQISSKFIDKDNCFDFVSKDDKFDKIINLLCSHATIEDTLIYIKKGFEKGIISFDETVKSIRSYSRELMKLKFIKDKILSLY